MTAYEAMGGESAVREVLSTLYDDLFVDPIVGFLFRASDKAHIVEEQVALTCAFLGGPQRYQGKPLPEAHAKLPLLPGHFDRRHRLLEQALEHHGVPDEARREWLRIDEALRSSVLASGLAARAATHAPDDAPR
jgi:hemoglobin